MTTKLEANSSVCICFFDELKHVKAGNADGRDLTGCLQSSISYY